MLNDIFGTQIETGDYIAYAAQGSGSSHGTLRIGKVLSIAVSQDAYGKERPRVHVLMVAEKNYADNKLVAKKTTISKVENIVIIHPDTLSAEYKSVLG